MPAQRPRPMFASRHLLPTHAFGPHLALQRTIVGRQQHRGRGRLWERPEKPGELSPDSRKRPRTSLLLPDDRAGAARTRCRNDVTSVPPHARIWAARWQAWACPKALWRAPGPHCRPRTAARGRHGRGAETTRRPCCPMLRTGPRGDRRVHAQKHSGELEEPGAGTQRVPRASGRRPRTSLPPLDGRAGAARTRDQDDVTSVPPHVQIWATRWPAQARSGAVQEA